VTEITTHHDFIIAIIVAVLVISFSGPVYADIPVLAVPEQAVISTTTSIDAQGLVTTSTSLILQIGTYTLNDPPLENGGWLYGWRTGGNPVKMNGYTVNPWVGGVLGTPLPLGEVQYSAGYNEEMTAVSGNINYQKTMSISTANKIVGEDNIAADTQVTFIGVDGGRMIISEDILLDGTGAQTVAANQVCCPFAGTTDPFFPPFSNIVVSGSSADISTGSISMSAGARFISASADIPVSETYRINVKGVTGPGGHTAASGTVSAFMKAHLQEGREQQVPKRYRPTDIIGFIPGKAEDLTYSETSMARGLIYNFSKDMWYQSGIRLV
jgi:hypothetical protein